MTYKNTYTNEYRIADIKTFETFGGKDFHLSFSDDMIQLISWWQEWKPVFDSKDPSVVDLLNQAKVLSKVV
ncbi:MAG: hypothetical protein RLZZ44_950 [Bacteroidota bacterium]